MNNKNHIDEDQDPLPEDEHSEEEYMRHEALKSEWMETVLGKEHDMVMHAMIPYFMGGSLDLYYYPNGIEGTGIATKELFPLEGSSAKNAVFDALEWVMFTRQKLDMDNARNEEHPFGKMHQTIARILNPIANYSEQAQLNPNETCEFPEDMEEIGGSCLIFDDYNDQKNTGPGAMGLMLCIRIFRQEMEYARKHGGAVLLELLKNEGHYPYSDLEREPVV